MSPLAMLSSNSASLSCEHKKLKSNQRYKLKCAGVCSLSHHLPLLLQDDGLPGPLPQTQGLVVGRRHDVVAVGADGETPNLPMVAL